MRNQIANASAAVRRTGNRCAALAALLLLACACAPAAAPATTTPVPIRAVYLVGGQAVLTPSDVQAHPEILVVHSFDELAAHMSRPVAIWIDKSSTPFGSVDWLNAAPQAWYPMVLVGYNNPLYSFDRMMDVCCFSGPAVIDWGRLEPGFSVIQREDAGGGFPQATFIQGYDQAPAAGDILAITDALLDGRIKPTSSPVITAATPTPPPVVTPFMAQVELDGFSGLPNLTWPLSRAQIDTLRSKLAALSPAAAEPYPDRLGYRGLIVTLADRSGGRSPDTWHVWGGVAQMTNGAITTYYADPDHALERWLLQTGQPYLPSNLIATVQAEISSTPTP